MIIFPAVDLQHGKAVRLKRGEKDQSTVFGSDPVAVARRWRDEGATWLHIVDLDGAFEGHCANAALIGKMVASVGIKVQVGGGIRTLDNAREYLDAGAARLIIGTVALEQPKLFAEMCQEFPGKIGVSLDASNGQLKTRGWVKDTGKSVAEVITQLESAGAAFVIYTDINRDGMQCGVNLAALTNLLEMTALPVIVAGGVHNLDDIKAIRQLTDYANLEGVITGRALYEGTLDLREAMRAAI